VTHHRRSPRSLDLALDALRDSVAPDTLLARIQRIWPEAVGPAIAREAFPSRERGGVLTVSCSASVWAQELALMASTILDQLNQMVDGGPLTRLRCVTA
jgi:predicted nucleic acid-binding Zn ribbon protein